MSSNGVVLFGVESRYIYDVIDIIERSGRGLKACVRSKYDAMVCGELPTCFMQFSDAPHLKGSALLVPLLTPGRKKRAAEEAHDFGLSDASAVFDPSAVVSGRSVVADGSIVGPVSVLAANCSIGAYVSVNRAASIGHDCLIDSYCSIGPGASLSGACQLEPGVFIGSGAVLAPKVRIGRNAVIGSGAVVINDVPPHTVVGGNPAKIIKSEIAGYRDIGI
jgi:sugar O-acyltransferase (sialic acid O-acetyltransferase NeuD family)